MPTDVGFRFYGHNFISKSDPQLANFFKTTIFDIFAFKKLLLKTGKIL